MNVYLLKNFNNYYNRKIKFYSNILDYSSYFISVSGVGSGYTSYDFNPNEGVNTEITIGKGEWIDIPDYCIVQDPTTYEIVSRWYVIECIRTRGGQYKLILRRDLLADYWTNIINADTYIHRATIATNSPYITNGESISVNQIKKEETLLKDRTGCSWLVAYLARKDGDGETTALSGTVTPPGVSDLTAVSKSAWSADNAVTDSVYVNPQSLRVSFGFRKAGPLVQAKYLNIILNQHNEEGDVIPTFSTNELETGYVSTVDVVNNGSDWFMQQVGDTLKEVMSTIPESLNIDVQSREKYTELLSYDGKTIKFNDDENLYRINVIAGPSAKSLTTGNNNAKTLPTYFKMRELWTDPLNIAVNTANEWTINYNNWLSVSADFTKITLTLTSLGSSGSYTYNIPAAREHLTDAPYDMICAPYESVTLTAAGKEDFNSIELAVNTVFADIVSKYAGNSGIVYDLQRLPYCPISQLKENDGKIDYTSWDSSTKTLYITKENAKVGVIFACSVSNFSGTIQLDNPILINNPKMQSICEKYRFVSPNYSGIFEFDPVKNNGLSQVFYYCTYKPFQPFIQVTPNFNYLYGDDYRDNRGLICGGDFSMPIITSAWETYQRQNKNFQDIFDRGIQSLDLQQELGRRSDIAGAITGALSGTAAGALAGASMFGGWGALGGAVVGGVGSSVAAYYDYKFNEELRQDARDYRFDIHELQLGNVRALPQSLAKTSAFVISNKIWPFIEKYECTPEEKISVAQFIAYNGMTLGVIDKIENYIGNTFSYNNITNKNYIQGTVMRFNSNLDEEFHLAKEISNELYKGVYIEQWA